MAEGEIDYSNTDQAFRYPSVSKSRKKFEGTLVLPRNGYLNVLESRIENTIKDKLKYNASNILTQDVIEYCTQRIEAKHCSRSEKAQDYLTIARLLLEDTRYCADNTLKSIGFLIKHADKIGPGMVHPATDDDFYRQSNVAWMLVDTMETICRQTEGTNVRRMLIDPLINIYSSALAEFFYAPPKLNEDVYSDTHKSTSHAFMAILESCQLMVPEFFQGARHEFLKDIARDVFEYASGRHGHSHHKVLGISREFSGIAGKSLNEISTKTTDPIHLAEDQKGNFLIVAKGPENALCLLFAAKVCEPKNQFETGYIALNAGSVAELKQLAGAVRTNEPLSVPLGHILRGMSDRGRAYF